MRAYNQRIRGESWNATKRMFGDVRYLNSYAGFVRDLLQPTPREIPAEFTESEGEPEEPEEPEVPHHEEPEELVDEVPDEQPAGTAPWHCRTPDSFEPDEVHDDLQEDAAPMQ